MNLFLIINSLSLLWYYCHCSHLFSIFFLSINSFLSTFTLRSISLIFLTLPFPFSLLPFIYLCLSHPLVTRMPVFALSCYFFILYQFAINSYLSFSFILPSPGKNLPFDVFKLSSEKRSLAWTSAVTDAH